MLASDAIAEILKAEGVEQVFCFPFTPILESLAEAGIRPIVARQERVAENMADGFSRTSNGERIGVVTVQQSAGAENAFAGIAQAYTDSTPLLFLPGHPGSQVVGLRPTFDSTRNYAATTKWADLIPSAGAVTNRMRRAFTLLRSGRPGPVLLEVPVDVARQELPGSLNYQSVPPIRPAADPQAVVQAVRLLLAAERPMIWAGQGVLYAGATAELTRVAELLAAPVMTTILGKSGFDERHPLALGTGGYSCTDMVTDYLKRCDTLFAVGASLSRNFTAPRIPRGKTLIHATLDPTDLNANLPAQTAMVGDAKLVLLQMIEELQSLEASQLAALEDRRQEVEKHVAQVRKAWQERWAPKLAADDVPINPYRVIGDFMKATDPAKTIVTHDSGSPRDQLVPLYRPVSPRGYLGWGHSTQLGFSLGAAMGAKVAAPDKLVAHFLGDAAFGMVGMDMETAAREKIPILTVLLNNAAMGNYEKHIPKSSQRYGTKFLSGNYSEVARGLGVYAERVETPDEVLPALKRGIEKTQEGQPALLEFLTREEPDIPFPPG